MNFPLTDEMKEFFIKEKQEHVRLVNHFAGMLGMCFPEHDKSKFNDPELSLLAPHFWKEYHREFIWRAEWDELEKQGKRIHQATNPHHAEFWKNIADMDGSAIVEMCCDWCAVTAQKRPRDVMPGDTIGFYRMIALPKYGFAADQRRLIENTLEKLARGK